MLTKDEEWLLYGNLCLIVVCLKSLQLNPCFRSLSRQDILLCHRSSKCSFKHSVEHYTAFIFYSRLIQRISPHWRVAWCHCFGKLTEDFPNYVNYVKTTWTFENLTWRYHSHSNKNGSKMSSSAAKLPRTILNVFAGNFVNKRN